MCELDKKVDGTVDSGLFGLHVKDVLQVKPFAISKNWLVLGRAVSPWSATSKMSKHHKIQKIKNMVNTKHSPIL